MYKNNKIMYINENINQYSLEELYYIKEMINSKIIQLEKHKQQQNIMHSDLLYNIYGQSRIV
tara:strand:+ start:7095 stop:7280 length:186 start_codon:yes stop_codon:yes gene_type:complete